MCNSSRSPLLVREVFKMMKRGEIDIGRELDIEFVDEDGIDAKGLTREYLNLVLQGITDGTGSYVLFEDWECLRWWHPSSASRKGWYPILDGSSRVCVHEFLTLKSTARAVQHVMLHQVFTLRRDEIDAIQTGLDSVNVTEFLLINEFAVFLWCSH